MNCPFSSPAPSPPYSSSSPGQALPSVTEDDSKEDEEEDGELLEKFRANLELAYLRL